MSNVSVYVPLLLRGTLTTIVAWLTSCAISQVVGSCLGISSSRYLNYKISHIIRIYTFIAKGIPAYVQILIAYFVLPALLTIQVPGFIAATGALCFCSSGYMTEIIRAGINAVPRGQWEACKALGYPMISTVVRIIIPQIAANALPAIFGEFEQLLKSTSLLATIGVMDLTRAGMNIISRELNPVSIYFLIACIYLFLSGLLQCFMIYLEKRKTL